MIDALTSRRPAAGHGPRSWPFIALALNASFYMSDDVSLPGVALFLDHEPQAGTAYRALHTNSILAAFKDARLLYPKRPLVMPAIVRAGSLR